MNDLADKYIMEITSLIIVSLVVLCAIKLLPHTIAYFQKRKFYKSIQAAPCTNYPILGQSLVLRGDPDEMYERLLELFRGILKENGNRNEIVNFWMGPVPTMFIVGANAAEVILRSSQNIRKSYFYKFLHSWLGTGLLTADGQKWKDRRRLLTPTFHFSILQDFLEVMNEQARVFQTKLGAFAHTGESFNIAKPVTLCALDIICETAMGKSISAQDNKDSEYVKALIKSSDIIQERQKSPWLWSDFIFDHTAKGKKYSEYLDTLHSFTQSVIKDRMKEFNAKDQKIKKKRLAFLDLLLSVSDEGRTLSFSDIQEEVDTFMFEGHDTTAAAMGWALHLIGSHPDVQKLIQEEVDEVMGDEADRTLSMEDVKKLEYLELVLKESLRLFPSVPFFGRTTTTECVLDGHHIPVGTECMIVTQMINSNKKYWTNPESFDPERFRTENSVGRHPYAYLPFSAGPRNCIGQRFALMEEKVMLAYLFRRFNIKSCDKTKGLRLMGDLILRSKTGINVSISERQR